MQGRTLGVSSNWNAGMQLMGVAQCAATLACRLQDEQQLVTACPAVVGFLDVCLWLLAGELDSDTECEFECSRAPHGCGICAAMPGSKRQAGKKGIQAAG
eukprot:1140055-Pelagomonas_calceolata.AAC.1